MFSPVLIFTGVLFGCLFHSSCYVFKSDRCSTQESKLTSKIEISDVIPN